MGLSPIGLFSPAYKASCSVVDISDRKPAEKIARTEKPISWTFRVSSNVTLPWLITRAQKSK